jgi:hypothetical protein
MLKSHVLKDDRPSKEAAPRSTAIHVSWTTSSAVASESTKRRATRTKEG